MMSLQIAPAALETAVEAPTSLIAVVENLTAFVGPLPGVVMAQLTFVVQVVVE